MGVTTVEGQIFAALTDRLAELTLSPAMPIAWPEEKFEPPVSGKYLRVRLLPNVTERITIDTDGPHRHQGILQVDVVWPLAAKELPAREIAGLVANHFPADHRMVRGGISVRSTKRPDIAPVLKEDGHLLVPVSVSYETYA